jgi:preprotein translocase subunit SecE
MKNSLTGAFRNAKSELAKVIFPTQGQVKQAFLLFF